ncbi:restriction endonuclease subunit S [Clostridium tertium]|uniref:restriction endonuclease subunit S n=1 Tax=Clostridium tertium TaxID=1559 RepID=UPI00241C3034|nr:restriction endonuclease subunit S [Clostridium tertium]
MSDRLKPYEQYKEVSAVWIDKIPSNWKCEKLGINYIERKSKVSDKDYEPLSVTKKGIVPQLETAAKSNDSDNRKLVMHGDFVINSRSDRKGSSGVSKLDGSVSLINIVLQPIGITPNYSHYLLRSNDFVEEYYRNGRGIVADLWTTRYSEMRNILIPIPSIEEQNHIAKFLDYQLFKINKLIKAKKKQVMLLKEQKQAIIDNAITKGINIRVNMKDSGVGWLGYVPEIWEVRRIKSVATVSPTINQLVNERSLNDKVVFLPMDKISSDGDIDNSEWRKIKDVKTGFTSFAKNDVVVAKITPCFENGKGACLDKLESDFGYGTTELIVLRASEKIDPKYLYYITRISHFRILGEKDMTGSAGQKRVPTSFVGNFTLGIPKREEQIQIIEYIEKKKIQIENVIQKIASEIEFISEYKNSLISSVVTGKVDVRDIQINEKIYEIDDVDTEESEECECDSDLNKIEGDE